MQVLTPTGYVNIDDLSVGQEVLAYDINDGHVFSNVLEAKVLWSPDMFPPTEAEYEHDENGELVLDENGDPIVLVPAKSSLEIFNETYGEWKFFKINDEWTLFHSQSIWANLNVVHASDLVVGDIIYSDTDEDIVVTSIEEVEVPNWWRLTISGDHSYIADGLTFHNASRYWVGGGSSSNWNATGNTNWGSVSGGANNSSVPTSADDVIFDGAGVNGNTNSTISAGINIKSLDITAGYTATMTHNALLTLSGNWTFRNTYTIAGTAAVTFNASATITSNGATWPNALNFTLGILITLSGNLTVNGLTSCVNSTTLNATTNESITCAGGITNGFIMGGTAKIILTGGTWTDTNAYGFNNPLDIQGNITISGSVKYGYLGNANTVLTYVSGTVTTTGSTIVFTGSCTLNTNGITWNNVFVTVGSATLTLTSNFSMSGGFLNNFVTTINTSVGATWTISGGITVNNTIQGTAKIILTGGTWSGNGTTGISNNLDINGNVTVSGNVSYTTGVLTYISGTVTCTGTLFLNASSTLNTSGISWNNMTSNGTTTHTLTSNLSILGLFIASGNTTFNRTTTETVTIFNGITLSNPLSGTAEIYLKGGTWSAGIPGAVVNSNLFIDGNVTIGFASYGTRTLTYVSGTVTTTGSNLYINSTCTLNTNGITWNNFSNSSNGKTITLTSNLTIGGLFTNTLATINQSTTQSITCLGGITVTGALTGSAKMILAGGVWTGASNALINLYMNTEINGNITLSAVTAPSFAGTLKYISGTVTTTGSTLNILNGSTTTLDAGAVTFNNIYCYNTIISLVDNLVLSGTLGTDGATWNTSTGKTVTANGLTFYQTSDTSGTAEIILTGGTWSAAAGTRSLRNALTFNGNVTVSGTVYYRTGPLKYLSGTITTAGSTLTLREITTLDTNGMTWGSVRFDTIGVIYTLASNFAMSGQLTVSVLTTINTSVGATFTIGGGMVINNTIQGTANIYLTGGTWSGTNIVSTNLFLQGNITISGGVTFANRTLTYVSGVITTTSSELTLEGATTLNTAGITWGSIRLFGTSVLLTSNLSLNGLLNVQVLNIINQSTTQTVTAGGGIYTGNNLSGTAKIILTGGTWTASNDRSLSCNLDINGNVTVSGTVFIGDFSLATTTTVTYLSGTVNTTGSTLSMRGNCIFNTNGMTWGDVRFTPLNTTQILTSNFSMSGLLTMTTNGIINTSVGATWTVGGGMTINGQLSGTADIYWTGGTWSGGARILSNLYINGDTTISGNVNKQGGIFTYIGGIVNARASLISFIGSVTINGGTFGASYMTFGSIEFSETSAIKTLTGDMIIGGTLSFSNAAQTVNSSTNKGVYIYGALNMTLACSGTASFYLMGGFWFNANGISNNLFFNGNVTVGSSVTKSGGTLTYIDGEINTINSTLNITGNSNYINIDKMRWYNVAITAGVTATFDRFFQGTPQRFCRVTSTGGNYTLAFQDNFEKIGTNVVLNGATLSRPMQLLVISNSRFNTNRQTNALGIRYTNQSPNGIPKGAPSKKDTMTVPALGLASDPCFQIQ